MDLQALENMLGSIDTRLATLLGHSAQPTSACENNCRSGLPSQLPSDRSVSLRVNSMRPWNAKTTLSCTGMAFEQTSVSSRLEP